MDVRRRLEALLGHPSSADCQSTLAAFLWDRHVFETRSTETVVMVARTAAAGRGRPRRMALAAIAMTLSIGVLTISLRDPASVLRWSDAVLAAPLSALSEGFTESLTASIPAARLTPEVAVVETNDRQPR